MKFNPNNTSSGWPRRDFLKFSFCRAARLDVLAVGILTAQAGCSGQHDSDKWAI